MRPRSDPAWIVAGGAFLIGVALVALHMTHSGLWIDEIYTLHAINLPWKEMILERLARGHLPMYFGLMKWWCGLWSIPSELLLRLPSFIFWLLSVAAFVMLLRKSIRPTAMPFAFLFFALNGLALRQASEARMYTITLFLAVCYLAAYFATIRAPNLSLPRLGVIFIPVVAFWVSSTFILTVISFACDTLRRREWRALRYVAMSFLVLACTALVPLFVHTTVRERSEIAHVPPMVLFLHLITYVTGIVGWEDYYRLPVTAWVLQIIGGCFTVILIINLVRRWKNVSEETKTGFVVTILPLSMMFVSWALEKGLSVGTALHGPARYLIGSLPAAAVFTGSLCDVIWQTPRQRLRAAASMAIVLIINAFIVARLSLESPRELLTRYLAPRYRSGDCVVVVPDQAKEVVKMYVPQVDIRESFPRNLSEDELRDRLEKLAADADRMWLIWIHGKKSRAVAVADELFGKGKSSSVHHYLGERRVFFYDLATSHVLHRSKRERMSE